MFYICFIIIKEKEKMDKYCNVKDAAKILGIERHTIVNMVKDGRLDGKQFGKGKNSPYFIERESMVKWTK